MVSEGVGWLVEGRKEVVIEGEGVVSGGEGVVSGGEGVVMVTRIGCKVGSRINVAWLGIIMTRW